MTEGLNLAAAAKLAASETRLSNGVWPADANTAGYSIASTPLVTSVDIPSAQNIVITYSAATAEISGKTLRLRGSIQPGGQVVVWECLAALKTSAYGGTAGTVSPKYAPANCR